MQILYLSPTRFPTERAHGAQIAQMCKAFADLGHEVALLATSRKDTHLGDPYEYYDLPSVFSICYAVAPPWGVRTKLGFISHFLLFAIQALYVVLRQKSDLVYTRDEYLAYALTFIINNEKILWESHEAKYNFAAKALFKKGVKSVVISEGVRDFYLGHGIANHQLNVAHDGIDESFFGPVEGKKEARLRLGIATDKPVVMYIGGLDAWKGVEVFLEASKYNDSFLFVVIGGRPEEVEKYQKQYQGVQFLGQRPYSELKDNQQAADVLVVPNTAKNDLSAKYTSPLKLFSYLASQVPIVASDIPSLRQVAGEGTVWYFEPDQPATLADVTVTALQEKTVSAQQILAAVQLAKQFRWSERAKQILAFMMK